jgi:hypothetical protein
VSWIFLLPRQCFEPATEETANTAKPTTP